MQGVTRNPLADPGILGVEAGAALFVVVGDLRASASTALLGYVWFAFAGARWPPSWSCTRSASLGPRGRDAGEARARRRRGHRAARLVHLRDPAARRRDARPVPLLGGRLARRARRDDRRARSCRSSWSASCMALASGRIAQRAGARRRRRPAALGQRVRLARAVSAPSPSCCCAARRPRPRGRSRSSGSRSRTSRGRSRGPTTAGSSRTPLVLGADPPAGRRHRRARRRPAGRSAGGHRHRVHRRAVLRRARRGGASWPSCDRAADAPSIGAGERRRHPPRARRRSSSRLGARARGRIRDVFCVSVSVGDFPIPLPDVVPALFGFGDRDARLHRAHAAAAARADRRCSSGAAFGFSGAIFQSLARNPLASPDIIGISAGAAAGAVFVIVCSAHAGSTDVASRAFGGALLDRGGDLRPRVQAGRLGLPARARRDRDRCRADERHLVPLDPRRHLRRAARDRSGSPAVSTVGAGTHVRPLVLTLLVLVPVVLVLARPLRALQLGDDTAKGLGAAVDRARDARSSSWASRSRPWPRRRPARSRSWRSWRPPIARRLAAHLGLTLRPGRVGGWRCSCSPPISSGARCSRRPSSRSVSITGSSARPYLLWLLAGPTGSESEGEPMSSNGQRPHHVARRCASPPRATTSSRSSADLSVAIPPGPDHRRSSVRTRAASRRCCARSRRLLKPKAGRGASRRRGDPAPLDEGRSRRGSASCRSRRSRRTGSRSPTWSAAAATPTRSGSGSGHAPTSSPSAAAMRATGTLDLADRSVDELSGGQRQRVWIAMALAQGRRCCCSTSRRRSRPRAPSRGARSPHRSQRARRAHDRARAARPEPGVPLRPPPRRDEGGRDRRARVHRPRS